MKYRYIAWQAYVKSVDEATYSLVQSEGLYFTLVFNWNKFLIHIWG